jgi:hypothetical protein
MDKIDLTIPQGAIFSEDRKNRYALWRVWSLNNKPLIKTAEKTPHFNAGDE